MSRTATSEGHILPLVWFTCIQTTRIFNVQVRTCPIRDGVDTVSRGLLAFDFERLKYHSKLTVLTVIFRMIRLASTSGVNAK